VCATYSSRVYPHRTHMPHASSGLTVALMACSSTRHIGMLATRSGLERIHRTILPYAPLSRGERNQQYGGMNVPGPASTVTPAAFTVAHALIAQALLAFAAAAAETAAATAAAAHAVLIATSGAASDDCIREGTRHGRRLQLRKQLVNATLAPRLPSFELQLGAVQPRTVGTRAFLSIPEKGEVRRLGRYQLPTRNS